MSRIRLSAALAGTVALVVGGASAASAHHCYIGTPTTHGPQSSNWFHITVEDAAAMFFGFEAECAAQSNAGYAALKEAGLPSSVKIFEKMTIGEGSQNPNGANGKGLEYFGAGSTVADDALATFVETAGATSCP